MRIGGLGVSIEEIMIWTREYYVCEFIQEEVTKKILK